MFAACISRAEHDWTCPLPPPYFLILNILLLLWVNKRDSRKDIQAIQTVV